MPHILEKIVEKIVIMPQVVEVLKYVHEIVEEETLGVAVGVEVHAHEIKYKEMYAKIRIHFETLLVELRRMKSGTPALKIQIEIIEAFLVELERMIEFPRIVQVNKEVIVEKEVSVPVLVPTKDSISIRNELSLSVLVEKLLGELRRITTDNKNIKLSLDEDIQLIFFSEAFGGANLGANGAINETIANQLRSYKESTYNNLLSYGKTWSTDHEMIFNTVLQERFAMANMIKQANLEIEKSRAISDNRLEAYKIMKQSSDLMKSKIDNTEREIVVMMTNVKGNPQMFGQFQKLENSFSDLKTVFYTDLKTINIEEPFKLIGEIHGSDGNFLRLQSAFREIERENEVLRSRYINLQKERPSTHGIEDRERIIANLRNQIATLTNQVGSFKSQDSVSVNIVGNTQEYEIKIRTLNSRIQEL